MLIAQLLPSPQVESVLVLSNYVDNIMLHADPFHSYCVALVVPVHQVLEKWAKEAGIDYKDIHDLCEKAEAINEVQQSLSKVCLPLPFYKIFKKLCIHAFKK